MINFEKEFMASKGQPIEVDGTRYCMMFEIPTGACSELLLTAESVNSEWKQGIHLSSEKGLEVDSDHGNDFVLWVSTTPKTRQCHCQPDSVVRIWNVWEIKRVTHSWHNGAAMIVTQLNDTTWRFQCNDGHPDNACDDLVFTIELKK